MKLVHVVSLTLRNRQTAGDALAYVRHLCANPGCTPVLLLCDLPDASCARLPEDDSMIQSLLAGTAAQNKENPGSVFLLVRRRVWDDAARQFLGSSQQLSCQEVMAQLLLSGETAAVFEAASIAPSSIKRRWDAVLFSDIALCCLPDIPMRMAAYLKSQALTAVGAHILSDSASQSSPLARLYAYCPFSLSSIQAVREYTRLNQELATSRNPVLYTLDALSRSDETHLIPLAPQCTFNRRISPDWQSVFRSYHALCRIHPLLHAGVPLMQLIGLAAAAVSGIPGLAVCALLPEYPLLFHLRAWPGVLLRMALLPLTALHALDMLLCRMLARSPLLRLRVPERLFSPLFFLFMAIMLLGTAFLSVYALVSVLPFAFLWLCMPLLYPAFDQADVGAAVSNLA